MERIDSGFILYHALSTRDSITISDLVGIKAQIEDFDKRFFVDVSIISIKCICDIYNLSYCFDRYKVVKMDGYYKLYGRYFDSDVLSKDVDGIRDRVIGIINSY